MDFGTVAFVIAILIVGVLVFLAILLTGKHTHHFNTEYYQTNFLAIENKLRKENPLTFTVSVIEADKLLDKAMTEFGFVGKTMGERLKHSGQKFSELNKVWNAHKLRNAIAHEPNFEISFQQAQNALATYKQALKDLGAI
ncbi:MAG: hypothetical protein MJZ22_01780 [Candidatus Saccharibacteria bacterium]|nr:hypothetical protein [Candidatus Saccharibacteria bacterium]